MKVGSTNGQDVSLFMDGVPAASACKSTIEVINPSNGRRTLTIPEGCEADVGRAVDSARAAFLDGGWKDMPPGARKDILHRLADGIEKDAHALDVLDAEEMGKPVQEKRFGALESARLTRFYAEAVDKVMGDAFSSDRDSLVVQRRVPRGVVAAVVPWNFPTFVAMLKVAPALAAGNSVVLKPSELSSRSAIRLASIAIQAGLPAGVLNVVPGRGEIVGRALGLHSGVDMVAFTGSTGVGKCMLQYAGQSNMKVVMAECGGKSPQIVFDDGVELTATTQAIARSLLTNQGQVCSMGSRVLVQRSIESEVVERIADQVRGIVIGDALDPRTTFGPLVSEQQRARVMRYIDSATTDGVKLVIGGHSALLESGGYFVEPTVFSGVPATARIAQEEIFGPVLSIIPFDSEADAVRIANGTIYGLIAYVWTADLSRGMRMAKSIRSSVIVNASGPKGDGPGHALSSEPTGQSGLGVEGGLAGMESYMRRQLVWINHA